MKIFFWLFMLVMLLILPGTMLFFGNEFLRRPGAINSGYGYRTKRSMASQEAWDFAHRTCGRLWMRLGKWLMAATVAAMLPPLGFLTIEKISMWSIGIMAVQLIVMIGTLFPVERALKKNFDQYGRPIQGQGTENN